MKKKITILFLTISNSSFSQYYNENEQNNFILANLIGIIIGLIVFAVITTFASYIEAFNKTKAIHKDKNQSGLIPFVIFSFIGFLMLFSFMNNDENLSKFIPILAVVIKFIMANYTAKKANKLGRNKIMWWILGFLEYNTALIVLAIRPAIIKTNNENKVKIDELNKEFNLKKSNLIDLQKANLLDENEFDVKYSEIENKYFEDFDEIRNKEQIEKNIALIEKLNQAYKDGLFTEDEYNKKLLDLKNNNNS